MYYVHILYIDIIFDIWYFFIKDMSQRWHDPSIFSGISQCSVVPMQKQVLCDISVANSQSKEEFMPISLIDDVEFWPQ